MQSNLTVHQKINARSNFSRHSNKRSKIPYDNRLKYLAAYEIESAYYPQDIFNKCMRRTKTQVFNAKK